MKLAILDIGSNSVRLMLRADGKTLYKKVSTTRLGEGLALSGALSEEAMRRTLAAISAFSEEGRRAGAEIFAFATAAVRASSNGKIFSRRVKEECGLDLDVVSGEEEAALAVFGALGKGDGGIVDIGGASTEIAFRVAGETVFSVSLPVGCVRLHDRCGERRELLSAEIARVTASLPKAPRLPLYAVGGTASTLASVRLGLKEYDGKLLQGTSLSEEFLSPLVDRLFALGAEDRKKIPGMDPARADIIAGGALLLLEIVKKTGAGEALFSDSDNLEGYLVLRGLE